MSTPWPDGIDLETFLEGANLTIPVGVDPEALVTAAVRQFVRTVGHGPFLAEGLPETVRHDPPGPNPTRSAPGARGGGTLLLLKKSFARIDEVRTGYVSESDPGDLLTRYDDFDFEPSDGGEGDKPITRIRFYRTQRGRPASVAVVGLTGYCTDLPEDVRQTVLNLAAASFCRQIKPAQALDVVEWKDGDESERKSIELLQALGVGWEEAGAAGIIPFLRFDS